MVLLGMLHRKSGVELIVAHFNHGIRQDAAEDETLVSQTAKKYGLKLELGRGNLGPRASEEKSRDARYKFLEAVRQKHAAKAIITAHHQGDLLETALINMLRGTGTRGLSAMVNNQKLLRPLLHIQKPKLIAYARNHSIKWRDDPSNLDTKYLRNYVRHNLITKMNEDEKGALLQNIEKIAKNNRKADLIIANISQNIMNQEGFISRQAFSLLPAEIGNELILFWLRQLGAESVNKKTIQRLSTAIKVSLSGTSHDVTASNRLEVGKTTAHFSNSF